MELLAGLANLSVCYLVRAFRQSMGVTPHDYLIRQRVGRAKQLLAGTDMPLSEIALARALQIKATLADAFVNMSECCRATIVGSIPPPRRCSSC